MKKFAILMVLSLFLWSCASTFQYVKSPKVVNNSDMTDIYVIRPSIWGSAIKIKIYQGEQLIGKLGPKSYLHWEIQPNDKVSIISIAENKDTLTFFPKAGESYYIEQGLKMGWAYARTELRLVPTNKGRAMLHPLKSPKVVAEEQE